MDHATPFSFAVHKMAMNWFCNCIIESEIFKTKKICIFEALKMPRVGEYLCKNNIIRLLIVKIYNESQGFEMGG